MTPEELRKEIMQISIDKNHGHIAPAFSIVEIICGIDKVLQKEDKLILSKGHACLALYAFLRLRGLNPDTTYGHPKFQSEQGIECTTGSLGHGLPIGVGMAFAKKFKKELGNIYVILGDGELQEGSIWESLLLASHYKLDNLIIIVDRNRLQALGFTEDILSLGNLRNKFKSFGCNYIELLDGHSLESIVYSLKFKSFNKPKVIVANTTKGKGIEEAENNPIWHYRFPSKEVIQRFIEDK